MSEEEGERERGKRERVRRGKNLVHLVKGNVKELERDRDTEITTK